MITDECSVYEAVNATRREVVLGSTNAEDLTSLRDLHARFPSTAMGEWRQEDDVRYRFVMRGLSLDAAKRFIAEFRKSSTFAGLTVRAIGFEYVSR